MLSSLLIVVSLAVMPQDPAAASAPVQAPAKAPAATESDIPFGQCILEQPPGKEWVHISLGAPYRAKEKCGQVLRFDGKSYTPLKH